MSLDLSGIWVAQVTPFDATSTHQLDLAALQRLVKHVKSAGITGLVVLGSTGEAAALDETEQDTVIATVLEAAHGLPVIAGLAGNHVDHLHRRLAQLNTLPLTAVLSPAPYYVRPSQTALIDHFSRLADASRAPIILYDIPYRTGVQMSLDTILELAAHPNIIGIKDCGGQIDKTQALIADGRLQVLAGEDSMVFHNLCLGGAGAISAAAQIRPADFMLMFASLRGGQPLGLALARRIQHELLPWLHAMYAEPNPALHKAALHDMGLCAPWTRAPLLPATPAAVARMMALTASAKL